MRLRASGWAATAVLGLLCLTCDGLSDEAVQGTNSVVAPVRVGRPEASIATRGGVPMNPLIQLEERITRSLKGFFKSHSINDTLPAPAVPQMVRPVPNRKDVGEERKDDWLSMTPEEFARHEAALELRQMLREGRAPDARNIPEDIWRREFKLDTPGEFGLSDSVSRSLWPESQPEKKKDSAPAEVVRSEEKLRSMLQESTPWSLPGLNSEKPQRSLFSGPDESAFSRNKSQDSYVDAYRQFMNPAPRQNELVASALAAANDPIRGVRAPGMDMNSSGGNILGQQFGGINPVLSPRQPLDTTERVLNQWNQYYTPPPPEPPRSTLPPRPTFEAPRRKF